MCLHSAFHSVSLVHMFIPIIVLHCFVFIALKYISVSGRVTLPPVLLFQI